MAYIGRGIDKLSNIEKLDVITFDGSSSYSLTKGSVAFTPSSANSLQVSIDGVVQAGNFTVSGSTIDFGTAVASTSTNDFIFHYGTGLITTPADGTVTTGKIQDGAVTGAKLASGVGGKVLQVVSTTKTDTFSSTTTGAFTDVTGMSASITPSSTSNKILVIASINSDGGNNSHIRLVRDSTAIFVGDTAGSRSSISGGIARYSPDGDGMINNGLSHLDSPSSTSSLTYKIQFYLWSSTTWYLNRTTSDSNAGYGQRSASSITLMEIAG